MTRLKVLVISRNAWDDTNSVGNTMSNFFRNMPDAEFANLYFRTSKPNNSICTRYFHVTERDIIRHWFSPSKIGSTFMWNGEIVRHTAHLTHSTEKKLISVIHKYNLKFIYALSNYLWDSRKWLNERLDQFVRDFEPDVVFSFVKADPQYYWTIRHLRETFGVRTVFWIADDEYSLLRAADSRHSRIRIDRLRYIIDGSSKVYGCSEEICSYYNRIFGCNASALYKNCEFIYPIRTSFGMPLRMVYAGNLLFGRYQLLQEIVRQLTIINAETERIMLEIYSNTPLSAADVRALDIPGVSKFCGVKPYSEIQRLLSESDLVLHVESFEHEEMVKTRYSFSTKIIDCLQSGSTLLALGPRELSSIKYIEKIPGAIVVDDVNRIGVALVEIYTNRVSLPQRAQQIREYAEKYHSAGDDWL